MSTYVTAVNGVVYRLTTHKNEDTLRDVYNERYNSKFVMLYDAFVNNETTYKNVILNVNHIVSIETNAD